MAIEEWIREDSPQYEKILLFNDPKAPLMHTAPGEKLACLVNEAYAYITKKNEVVIGLVPKVQFAVNMIDHPMLAGEYVINRPTATDTSQTPRRLLISHQQYVTLDDLNHIIDLNRPDVLDPQMISNIPTDFKKIASEWGRRQWLSADGVSQILSLPDEKPELIPVNLIKDVMMNAAYKRALSEWREANWVSEKQAHAAAVTTQPLKTIDDELGFEISLSNE